MAGTKISALTAGIVPAAADPFVSVQGGVTVRVTSSQVRRYIGEGLSAASVGPVSLAFAADTYLTGSAIVAPVGAWAVSTIVRWVFDMVKTAAGIAGPVITVRMGTSGTLADAAINSFTFGAGTAAADTGRFDVDLIFRTVGAGTAATVGGMARCTHHLAATGLTSTGAGDVGIVILGAAAGFDSTTPTTIGLSFNGGAAFSGANTVVTADADKI